MLPITSGELNRFHSGNEKKLCLELSQIKPTLQIAELSPDRHFSAVDARFRSPANFILDQSAMKLPARARHPAPDQTEE
jgi:hypothetical protein